MPRFRIADGITTGLVAASATTGALVGFGLRFGTPARPFNAIGAILLGVRAEGLWRFAVVPTVLGVLLHIGVMTLCGVLFVALVARSGGYAIGWAILVAAGAFLVSSLAGLALGVGLATLLPVGDRLVLALVLAASLPLGMRLAFSVRRRD